MNRKQQMNLARMILAEVGLARVDVEGTQDKRPGEVLALYRNFREREGVL